ncbi:hypothetical protein I7I50_07088 [Histoplasma capsulatum G186AR]|uniref:Uncharacterized protein n=1 Tax=Ajellomyces capsulatus TaxID=5037 RepID=A0A8H7Z1L4_AJECA|nr:hypothetical protein I7I52_09760 [Histoplasma capsulatum]QSS67885.1 hypothetical protein I7I50_07088 [Histoplasma capsulatum G186AR]
MAKAVGDIPRRRIAAGGLHPLQVDKPKSWLRIWCLSPSTVQVQLGSREPATQLELPELQFRIQAAVGRPRRSITGEVVGCVIDNWLPSLASSML